MLHGHDITFSISLRESHIPDGSKNVLASHRWLMSGIVAGLRLLQIEAEIGGTRGNTGNPTASSDCFARISQCDVRLGTSKIAGAAQVRRSGSLLEQGSIPYKEPTVDPARVFGGKESHSPSGPRALEGASQEGLEQAIIRGFQHCGGIRLQLACLSEDEVELALKLENDKYTSAHWTYDRATMHIDNGLPDCYTDKASLRGGR